MRDIFALRLSITASRRRRWASAHSVAQMARHTAPPAAARIRYWEFIPTLSPTCES